MDIIGNFGINPYLLGAQIVNFLILLYIMKRFALKPIQKMLADRKATIKEGLKSADESRQALEKALEEEKKILRKAQNQAEQILSDAKNQAQSIHDDAKKSSKKQVEQMLADAHDQIARDARETEKRIAVATARLAVDMVKEAIDGVFDEKEQKEALKKLTDNLEKVKK